MSYGRYTLPDGREAGYLVATTCDEPECAAKIDRGFDYLCGDWPDDTRDGDRPGCGKYHCTQHQYDGHKCTNPQCGKFAVGSNNYCGLAKGHDDVHRDLNDDTEFIETEDDE